MPKGLSAVLTAFADEHAAAPAAAAAAPVKGPAPTTQGLADLRNSVFKNPSLDTARQWASGLDDLKGRCFEENEASSCQTLGEEMQQAANLFNYLSVSTKATSQEALRKANQAIKTAAFDWLMTPAICLKPEMPALTAKAPASPRDFL